MNNYDNNKKELQNLLVILQMIQMDPLFVFVF